MDDGKPLETINPAWYARHPKKRYAETQILIQWKNIADEEGVWDPSKLPRHRRV